MYYAVVRVRVPWRSAWCLLSNVEWGVAAVQRIAAQLGRLCI